jgi:hypothetical protein
MGAASDVFEVIAGEAGQAVVSAAAFRTFGATIPGEARLAAARRHALAKLRAYRAFGSAVGARSTRIAGRRECVREDVDRLEALHLNAEREEILDRARGEEGVVSEPAS